MKKKHKELRARAVQVLQRHYNWFTHLGYEPFMQSISKFECICIVMRKQQESKMCYLTLVVDLDKMEVDSPETPYLRIIRRTTVKRTLKGFDLHDNQGKQLQFEYTRHYREKTIWI